MKWFYRRDVDGFFGLFIDNLVQMILIVGFSLGLLGMNQEPGFLFGTVLPGVAVSVTLGSLDCKDCLFNRLVSNGCFSPAWFCSAWSGTTGTDTGGNAVWACAEPAINSQTIKAQNAVEVSKVVFCAIIIILHHAPFGHGRR